FLPLQIPTDPDPTSKALYAALQKLEPGSTVIVQTDWTNSTRGESMGHFESLMRILMAKDVKFVFYSAADPVAPQVARTVLTRLHAEREAEGLKVYQIGEDYIDLGYFANAEATNTNMGTDLRNAWKGKKTKMPGSSTEIDIFQSPVLSNIRTIGDAKMMLVITASASIDIAVQRLNDKVKMGAMVTGVVGPSVLSFYQAKQVVGVAVGLKGVYDMEYMMEHGINVVDADGKATVKSADFGEIPKVETGETLARGAAYYGTLHVALLRLFLAV